MLDTVPEQWIVTKFTSVLDIQGGTQPPKSQFIDKPEAGYVRLLQIRDFGNKPVPTYIPDTKQLKKCKKTDLLIGRYGASLGRICTGMEGAYNVALAKVVSGEYLNRNFLKGYLESELFQLPLSLLSRSAQNGFNKEDLASFDFALPPLAEQKVIAEKLDALLAQVETTKARLERVPDILKRFRQSVLAAAVSGRLTEEWRETNLQENISIKDLPDSNKTRRGLPDHVVDSDALVEFSFPENWDVLPVATLLRKGVIIDLKDGNHGANHPKSSEFTRSGLPFITAAQMAEDGEIDYVNAPKVSGKSLDKLKVGFAKTGDVIYSHKGTVGRVGIADRECVLSPQTTYIRLNPKYVINRFYALMLKSLAFSAQVDAIKSQTTRDFVPITAHYSLFSIIAPIEEQAEIVRRVEQLFAFADIIEQKANAALARVNNLTQSILAKAFRGELTTDWRAANPDLISGENSAAALLERLKAERETNSVGRKRR